jgi:hypothetical protein
VQDAGDHPDDSSQQSNERSSAECDEKCTPEDWSGTDEWPLIKSAAKRHITFS